jgi:hypothetical protein
MLWPNAVGKVAACQAAKLSDKANAARKQAIAIEMEDNGSRRSLKRIEKSSSYEPAPLLTAL